MENTPNPKILYLGLASIVVMAYLVLFVDFEAKNKNTLIKLNNVKQLTDSEYTFVNQSVEQFTDQCSAVIDHRNDIEEINATLIKNNNPQFPINFEEKYGWQQITQIKFKISAKPTTLPSSYFAAGQTCLVDIGLDRISGIYTTKTPCLKLCNITKTDNKNQLGQFLAL